MAETELKVQRSRFLGLVFPIESELEARRRLDEIARRFHDARHMCYGYRLGRGCHIFTRKSDAGEPSGTAGEPLLAALVKLDLTDVLVVVVRYFGGIKLGTGGLARAYGQAGAMALAQAGVRVVPQGREFLVRFPYAQEKTLRYLLESCEGKLIHSQYAQEVTWRIWLAHSVWRGFAGSLAELTAGAISLDEPMD